MVDFDPDIFFDVDYFAASATIDGETVRVIPTEGYAEDLETQGTDPVIVAPEAELPAGAAVGSVAVWGGKTYRVATFEPAGDGTTVRMRLEFVA